MQTGTLILLGFFAGATIVLGLPIARLKSFNATMRSSLTMFAAGILVFLLVEILGDATGETADQLRLAGGGATGAVLTLLLAIGLLAGFVGLIAFEQRVIRGKGELSPERLSFTIAAGIGLHNLSEGLAIGQSYAQGMSGFTLTLIIGFGLHNATEGFGIVGPMVQRGSTVSWGRLALLALIGGGPTFVGTVLGSLWSSTYLSVAVLGMAGGALLYVLKQLFSATGKAPRQTLIMTALVAGFLVGWGTSVIADAGVATKAVQLFQQMKLVAVHIAAH
ncbi:MAG TPA: ZIP family metal transporter [Spirochaetia bacterium]|nr:ZIP family metal transporter [Spirochaetia bacterium]